MFPRRAGVLYDQLKKCVSQRASLTPIDSINVAGVGDKLYLLSLNFWTLEHTMLFFTLSWSIVRSFDYWFVNIT